jgi:CMP/dCMP kinase
MIISISGKAGSGKSTVAKLLSEKMGLGHYSSGDFMRDIAKEHKLTLLELSKLAEKETWIDKELDIRQKKLGKTEDNFVIDGRLSWHFIPKSIKIYLDVDDKVAVSRIWGDKINRKEESYNDIKELTKKLKQRQASEIKRYKQYYNLNYHDKKNYDLIIDTSDLTPNSIVKKIIEFAKKKR